MFRNLFRRPAPPPVRHPSKATPLILEKDSGVQPRQGGPPKPAFSKVFRYRLPEGQTTEPQRVEVAGSFTHWQKIPLLHCGKLDGWHTTIHHIPGNRIHHYMLLVDDKPVLDHASDGLAIPRDATEEQFALSTEKGPRVLMLFAQAR